jgi:hypothetical protein
MQPPTELLDASSGKGQDGWWRKLSLLLPIAQSKGDTEMSSSSSAHRSGMDISAATLVMAFIAGALAVPIFHQIAMWLLNTLGIISALVGIPAIPIFSMAPTKPLGVPEIFSISFWGGVWGVAFALTLPRWFQGIAYWIAAAVIGGLALTLVYIYVVTPLKTGGPAPFYPVIVIGFVVNAAWGIGWALFLMIFERMRSA